MLLELNSVLQNIISLNVEEMCFSPEDFNPTLSLLFGQFVG